MEIEQLTLKHHSFLKQLHAEVSQASSVVISTHVNADTDAVATAIGLYYYLSLHQLNSNISIILPSINQLTVRLLDSITFEHIWKQNWPSEIDLLIIVDTYNPFLTEIPQNEAKTVISIPVRRILYIDHHQQENRHDNPQSLYHICSDASSAAEIICEFFRLSELIPPKKIVELLLYGIITDSGFLRFSSPTTLRDVGYLLEFGFVLRDLLEKLQVRPGRSERIARLKAAIRMQEIHEVRGTLVVISHVNSYDASASRALIDMGADLSFVIAVEKKKRFRVSARAADEIIRKYALNLSAILSSIAQNYKGSGGGHDGAAGCYGFYVNEDYMGEITPKILEIVENYFKSLKEHSEVQ